MVGGGDLAVKMDGPFGVLDIFAAIFFEFFEFRGRKFLLLFIIDEVVL